MQLDVFGINPLTVLIFAPALGGLLVLGLPNNKTIVRWASLIVSLGIALLAAIVFFAYDRDLAGYQFVTDGQWFPPINARWTLGVDGISIAMVLLTGILVPLAVLISWEIEDRFKAHLALILFFETGLMGVFVAQDMMIFFLFYEVSLVPIYFLIKEWGGANRQYASTKFFIYSVGGTLGMLLATQLIGLTAGTFNIEALANPATGWPGFNPEGGVFLGADIQTVKTLAFIGFFIAFCIKVPVWPFHTWLPDAHSEAPTAGSMLLAGVMLKLGAYGFIRLVIPLFPDIWVAEVNILGAFTVDWAGIFAFLAMLGVVLGAFAAFGQNDIKRLVAYSSVNHMGFVALGIAVYAAVYGRMVVTGSDGGMMQDAIIAGNGAVLQMFNHGLSSAGMFLLAGAIYHKTHTRDLREYGGLWVKAPVYGAVFIFTSMASLGLPGLNGFVSEFLVVRGSWPVFTALTAISMIGLLFTGSYILKGIRAVLHGPFNLHWRDYHLEIERREFVAIAPLMVLMLFTGIVPNWILPVINDSVTRILSALS
ncbi:MAG: NADH-quinone oxidoreductase subunit M [Chloroflexi bacterium]|nr:NADH-quinone oxidoreductase subunit M [Chloroflexota bacterium]